MKTKILTTGAPQEVPLGRILKVFRGLKFESEAACPAIAFSNGGSFWRRRKIGQKGTFCIGLALIIYCFLYFNGISWSQENPGETNGNLIASLDRIEAKVGEIVELILIYQLPEGARLEEKPEIIGLEDLTVLGIFPEPEQIRIRILVDSLGSWKSGPLELIYVDGKGKQKALKSEPVTLTVLSNLGDKPAEAQLRPIRDIIPTRPGWLKALPWGIGIFTALLLTAGILVWHKRRKAKQMAAASNVPPHIRARNDMEELIAQGVFEKGNIKAFYFRFSEILRQYLEAIRRFPAAEFTTEEIFLHIDNEQDRRLLPLLRHADLVKFAESIPSTAGKEADVDAAMNYIRETTPVTVSDSLKETGETDSQ